MSDLNLARRPFVNRKPVRRAGLSMLILGLALLALNGRLYWQYFAGENETRDRSVELSNRIDEAESEVMRLSDRVAEIDLEDLNRRVGYVNLEIDRRRFAWSRLFDQLAQVQPGAVRLESMSPQFTDERRSRSRLASAIDGVTVDVRGVARSGEAILEFVDNLFGHAAFSQPDLHSERQDDSGIVSFDLTVLYDPKVGDSAAEGDDGEIEEDSQQTAKDGLADESEQTPEEDEA